MKSDKGTGLSLEGNGSGGDIPELGVANGVLLPLPVGSLGDWLLA